MSSKTPNDSSLQSTKQMLDELDALMDRMLALPVNEMEDAPAFPKEIVPERALTATLTLLQTPPPAPTPAPLVEMPLHPAVNPPHRPMAAFEPAAVAPVPPLFPPPAPLTNDVVPPSLLPKVEELLASVPDPSPSPASLGVYLPLLWINQAFDGFTLILGPSAAKLRSQAGRMLLGFAGVVLLLASATWFLKDWLGWQW
jgi:hypothetical protein